MTTEEKNVEFPSPEPCFAAELRKTLPPTLARKDIEKHLGGIISADYMRSLDSQGRGPEDSFKIGKTVCYSRESIIQWLIKRARESNG